MLQRMIPSSKELLPVIGLGTWRSFDVPPSSDTSRLTGVLEGMKKAGSKLIDSSPMYGQSEAVVGQLTGGSDDFFYATKVWTTGKKEGIRQMEESFRKMKRSVIDLMQIHNLVDWQKHLETLQEWKEQGRIRYIGITHYTDSMHEELEKVLRRVPLDFVQFNYSITDRHAETRLLPGAADLGVATLINRPFGSGDLFGRVRGKALPGWAQEWEIHSWSQFFLKFLAAHPAVTCIIPATANPEHLAANLLAGSGPMPDEAARKRMAAFIATT